MYAVSQKEPFLKYRNMARYRKTYNAASNSFTVFVKIKGVNRKIIFADGFRGEGLDIKASYTTDNAEVQQALEASPIFGYYFFKVKEEELTELPTVQTLDASSVTETGAVLNGVITKGTDEIKEKGFMYKAGEGEWQTIAGEGDGTITATLSGLTAETAYSFKAYCKITGYTLEGETKTFTTGTAAEPAMMRMNVAPETTATTIKYSTKQMLYNELAARISEPVSKTLTEQDLLELAKKYGLNFVKE